MCVVMSEKQINAEIQLQITKLYRSTGKYKTLYSLKVLGKHT